jgi:hypothetical protein
VGTCPPRSEMNLLHQHGASGRQSGWLQARRSASPPHSRRSQLLNDRRANAPTE